jgi:hypothetical protein
MADDLAVDQQVKGDVGGQVVGGFNDLNGGQAEAVGGGCAESDGRKGGEIDGVNNLMEHLDIPFVAEVPDSGAAVNSAAHVQSILCDDERHKREN